MKVSFLLIFITTLNVSAILYSQDTKLNVTVKDKSLIEVIRLIEKQSNYRFFFSDNYLDLNSQVSLNAKGKNISEVLSNLLDKKAITYKLLENNIVVITPTDMTLQLQKVTGTITDAVTGEPLPGVNIILEGSTAGTVTDMAGKYSINIDINSPNAVLIFSYIGYLSEKVPVSGQKVIDVKLSPDIQKLEEVVVVGYGTQKVKDLTSSIVTVKSDDLAKTPSGAPMQALQGKVAGLQVVSNGGPGSGPSVRVRGVGSYPLGQTDDAGNTIVTDNPLYVVDGSYFEDISFLNTSDIASISVLKDASAAAIYGVRAANGVVLIETKSGMINEKAQITYDGYYGTQIAQNVLKMANAEQFTTMAQESNSIADANYILNAMQRFGRSRINPNVPDVNTDWYKEILRPAPIQNHSLDVSGGSQKTSYSLGASYFSQQGILDMKNDFERFNLRSRIDYMAKDWLKVGGNMIFSNSTKYNPQLGAWDLAYYAVPILPVYDDQNTVAWPTKYASAQSVGYRNGQNPFPTLDFNQDRLKSMQLLANFYAEVSLIPKKLIFRTSYNNNYQSNNQRIVNLPYYVSDAMQLKDPTLVKKSWATSDQTWDNLLTFTNNFGNHNLVAMAGTSYEDESTDYLQAGGLNFPVDQEQSWYISQTKNITDLQVRDGGKREYRLSYFGRLSYNYNDKYLLYGTMRADGSSKYQEKWGYFPAVGAGWVISAENFMKNVKVIDFLKLRVGWGQLGNNKIPPSNGANTTTVISTAINDVLINGTTTSNTYSSLKWERTEETNLGITSRVLNNRLSVDADYYIRDTKNAVIGVTTPVIGNVVLKNVGTIRNSGIEVVLNWSDKLSNGIHYSIGGNISTLKNEVKDLYGQPYIDGGSAEFRQRSYVGHPLLAFYGYEVTGVYQNDAEIQADPTAVAYNATLSDPALKLVPGDFKYKDLNNDGVIDANDRKILGSYLPNFMYGFNCSVSYKNFDLSANMMGQNGNKILNWKRGQVIWTQDQNMDADLAINRWHGEGTSNKYPSSAGLRKGWNQKMSNYFVEDGSFFRIQNVQLAYNIKGKHMFGTQIPEIRISLTADRPLTVFKYHGFNPEIANGVDTQTYPIPAVYTVGLNIKF